MYERALRPLREDTKKPIAVKYSVANILNKSGDVYTNGTRIAKKLSVLAKA
jgi:hypothetical protein